MLLDTIDNQHEFFITLTATVAAVHEQVEVLREDFVVLQKRLDRNYRGKESVFFKMRSGALLISIERESVRGGFQVSNGKVSAQGGRPKAEEKAGRARAGRMGRQRPAAAAASSKRLL